MDNELIIPTLKDIQLAAKRIAPYIHKTPVLSSEIIDSILGAKLHFKCENFQKSGAFKYRGATNAILNLPASLKNKGLITHSSGNHAGALAKASSVLHKDCTVVMPENAPRVKVDAVKQYGAHIVFCKPTLEARETVTNNMIKKTGAVLIHPYNNYDIITGQGTAALELIETIKTLDSVICPVGGGGLLSGTAIACKGYSNSIRVYAGEPKEADDAYLSLNARVLIPQTNPKTIADGLLTSLAPLTFKAISSYVDEILTVKEKSIIEAMKMVWQYLKIVIEPSAAVPLAAIMENRDKFKNKKVGIILSGGNVDVNNLPF